LESNDCSLRTLLHLCMFVKDKLPAYFIKPDGSNGCCMAFAAWEYM
jgi:hypothetical protein